MLKKMTVSSILLYLCVYGMFGNSTLYCNCRRFCMLRRCFQGSFIICRIQMFVNFSCGFVSSCFFFFQKPANAVNYFVVLCKKKHSYQSSYQDCLWLGCKAIDTYFLE